MKTTGIGSVLYAKRPGDGSAREYAASCQKVLEDLPMSVLSMQPSVTSNCKLGRAIYQYG